MSHYRFYKMVVGIMMLMMSVHLLPQEVYAEIVLPSSLQKIEDYAFYDTGLEGQLNLPEKCKSIGEYAFAMCQKILKTVIAPEECIIEETAFDGLDIEIVSSQTVCDPKDFTYEDNYDYIHQQEMEGVSVTGYLGNSKILSIPAYSPEGKKVTEIAPCAFDNHNFEEGEGYTWTQLILPDTIEIIGEYAFRECRTLKGELIIPEGCRIIGDSAFQDCSGFEGDLILPDTLESVGTYAFCGTYMSGSLRLSNKLKEIPHKAFSSCQFTGSLELPGGLLRIGEYAFSYNCFTGDLIIPDSCYEVGEYAFYSDYDNDMFDGTLTLPDELHVIEANAFCGCEFTGELVLPSELYCIEEGAFSYTKFSSLANIPEEVCKIGDAAFNYCTAQMDAQTILPAGLNTLGNWAFNGCTNLTGNLIIPSGLTTIPNGAFQMSGLTGDLIIPNTVHEIGESAFAICNGLTGQLSYSSNVSIGTYAFWDCPFTSFNLPHGGLVLETPKTKIVGEERIQLRMHYTDGTECEIQSMKASDGKVVYVWNDGTVMGRTSGEVTITAINDIGLEASIVLNVYITVGPFPVPRVQQNSEGGDCVTCSVASLEAYAWNQNKGTPFTYNANNGNSYSKQYQVGIDSPWDQDPIWWYMTDNNILATNAWSTFEKLPIPLSTQLGVSDDQICEILYQKLQAGSPVVVYARGGGFAHASIVIAYNGNGKTLLKKDFTIMEVKLDQGIYWLNSPSYYEQYSTNPENASNWNNSVCYVDFESWMNRNKAAPYNLVFIK